MTEIYQLVIVFVLSTPLRSLNISRHATAAKYFLLVLEPTVDSFFRVRGTPINLKLMFIAFLLESCHSELKGHCVSQAGKFAYGAAGNSDVRSGEAGKVLPHLSKNRGKATTMSSRIKVIYG